MTVQRYHSDDGVDIQGLKKPLAFHFSKRIMKNRLFKASMGETLASWNSSDIEGSGVPTGELVELYRR